MTEGYPSEQLRRPPPLSGEALQKGGNVTQCSNLSPLEGEMSRSDRGVPLRAASLPTSPFRGGFVYEVLLFGVLLQPMLSIRTRCRDRSALFLNRLHCKFHQRSGNPLPPQAVVYKRPLNAIDLRLYLRKQNLCDSLAGFVLQIISCSPF